MKKLYSLLALMLVVASVSAQAWKQPAHMPKKNAARTAVVENDVKKILTANHEIYEDPTAYEGLVADSATAWYYADYAGTGTSTFFVFLSTNGINSSIPAGPGQMVRVMIFTEQIDATNGIVLPEGTYKIVGDDAKYAAGEVYPYNTDFIDAFYNPDDPTNTEDLVGYDYEAGDEGTVTITKSEDGTYNISVDMNFTLTDDETYETLDEKHVTMTYSGSLAYEDHDPSKYTPVEGEYVMDIPNASGRYSADGYGYGDFSIAFYSDDMLDEDGFIVAAGDLFNIELLTDEVTPADYSLLPGTYTVQDFNGGVFTPGHYVGGCWYNYYGYYFALGTALTVYEEDGSETIGLATDGTITISDKGNGVYRFEFDFTTPENAHLTGAWEGVISDYITDYTGISTVKKDNDLKISGRNITYTGAENKAIEIYAPNGARIASAAGHGATLTAPAAGLYIVKAGNKASKVIVK